MTLISVVVSTYNWPKALNLCLASLFMQSDQHFEIIVADDGSHSETGELIKQLAQQSQIPIIHCYHEDNGFRAAMIRNKAIAKSSGDYIIFLDGDCVTLPHFIARHRQLAQQSCFVPGNRVLISQAFTEQILATDLPLYRQHFLQFVKWRLQGKINRLLPLISLSLTQWRLARPHHWQHAMTCNLGVWKSDFVAVNGFDEAFVGWGYEDSDLIIRLIHNGIKRKEGRFAIPVLHLWHLKNDRSQQDANYQRLQERLNQPEFILAIQGVSQYLKCP